MSLNFLPLASSSAGCSYHLSGGGARQPILIDCGLSFKHLQRVLDFKVSDLAGVLVSHAHGDHCKAVSELLRSGVECFGSKETWETVPMCDRGYNAKVVSLQTTVKLGDWVVLPFECVHDCAGTLGFVIDSPQGDRLLYLTDTMYTPYKFQGLTHLAVEANHSMEIIRENSDSGKIDRERFHRTARNHMSLERLIEMLKSNDLSKVQQIFLLHLSSENSNELQFKDAVERATGIPTLVAGRGNVK